MLRHHLPQKPVCLYWHRKPVPFLSVLGGLCLVCEMEDNYTHLAYGLCVFMTGRCLDTEVLKRTGWGTTGKYVFT